MIDSSSSSRAEVFTIERAGAALQVVKEGTGPPCFLFIHGFGEGGFVWRHVVPTVLKWGAALAIDLRGHGASSHDPRQDYRLANHVLDVFFVCERLCPNPVVLIGHSLGAEIAMLLSAAHGSRTRGLVLVDGGPEPNRESSAHMHREFARQLWDYRTIEEFERHLAYKFPLAEPALLKAIAPVALTPRNGGFRLRCDPQLKGADETADLTALWEAFRTIRCPILVVRGAGSSYLSKTVASRVRHESPNCEIETIASAGHSVMLDNPASFLAVLHRYCDGVINGGSVVGTSTGAEPLAHVCCGLRN